METKKWTVNATDLFCEWLDQQDEALIEDALAAMMVLASEGPALGRPEVDHVKGSRFANMKELRIQSNGRPIRAFFAFDPHRQAILLCAADKRGFCQRRFYQRMTAIADAEYLKHLEGITR